MDIVVNVRINPERAHEIREKRGIEAEAMVYEVLFGDAIERVACDLVRMGMDPEAVMVAVRKFKMPIESITRGIESAREEGL